MIGKVFSKVFGTHNERELKTLMPIINQIEALEDDYRKLSDDELKAKTVEFKERLQNGETLDEILPEAFAAAR